MTKFDIILPTNIRFDDRKLREPNSDNGGDFERFVFEYFTAVDPMATSTPGLGRSRDGAIDIIQIESNGIKVIECKFIGKNATSKPEDRWREVYRNLTRNLPELASKPSDERGKSQYLPWLNAEQSIIKYVFCITSPFANERQRQGLERQIRDDFLTLSKLSPEIKHLASIQVETCWWNSFHAKLSTDFPLRFRWFGDLPKGITALSINAREMKTFKRFLTSEHLPYRSRENYNLHTGSQIQTENEVFRSISAEDAEHEALIISGAGGVGKTRLAFELCYKFEANGWRAFRLSNSVTSNAINELISAYSSSAKIVFLLDYAEAADALPIITEVISNINNSNQHHLRLIATCRSSALNKVKSNASELIQSITLNLGNESLSRPNTFEDWVIEGLLSEIPQENRKGMLSLCKGIPALAAFAVYLFKLHPDKFDEQFSGLIETSEYIHWSNKRTKFLRRGFDEGKAKQSLALLALILPITDKIRREFIKGGEIETQVFERLISDRWIEKEGDSWAIVHDVFADKLIVEYLDELPVLATDRLETILLKIPDEAIESAVVSYNRVANFETLSRIDGTSVLNSFWKFRKSVFLKYPAPLLNFQVAGDLEKLDFLNAKGDLVDAIVNEPNCYTVAMNIVETYSKAPERNKKVVNPIVSKLLALGFTPDYNKMLRLAVQLEPDNYTAKLLENLETFPTAYQSHFLLVAALKASIPIKKLKPYIVEWLNEVNCKTIGFSFVFSAWLDAGGEKDVVLEPLRAWLVEHQDKVSAQFVYRSWLDSGGEPNLVREPIQTWLINHQDKVSAQYIYKSWLDSGGEPNLVREPIQTWLINHQDIVSAQFVYKSWLDSGGEPNLVREPIQTWLINHQDIVSAQFVYTSWLDSSRETDIVQEPIRAWLINYQDIVSAQFVYKSWLDSSGETDIVQEPIKAWLMNHQNLESAQFVYRAWLEAELEFSTIRVHFISWFNLHFENEGALYALKYVIRNKLPNDTMEKAIRCCFMHPKNEDALWRILSLLSTNRDNFFTVPAIIAFAAILNSTDSTRFQRKLSNVDEDCQHLSFLTCVHLNYSLNKPGLEKVLHLFDTVHKRLILETDIYLLAAEQRKIEGSELIKHVELLIEQGDIDPVSNASQIKVFYNALKP